MAELEHFLANFLWFETLGALAGGVVAGLFIANARQQERWRREDQASEERKKQADKE